MLPGEGTFAERLATTCANASAELTQRGELHGYVINSLRDGADIERELLPIIRSAQPRMPTPSPTQTLAACCGVASVTGTAR